MIKLLITIMLILIVTPFVRASDRCRAILFRSASFQDQRDRRIGELAKLINEYKKAQADGKSSALAEALRSNVDKAQSQLLVQMTRDELKSRLSIELKRLGKVDKEHSEERVKQVRNQPRIDKTYSPLIEFDFTTINKEYIETNGNLVSVSADGRWMTSVEDNSNVIYLQRLDKGSEPIIIGKNESIRNSEFSPDGRFLIIFEMNKIMAFEMSGAKPKLLFSKATKIDSGKPKWAPDGLSFQREYLLGERPFVERYDLASGKRTEIDVKDGHGWREPDDYQGWIIGSESRTQPGSKKADASDLIGHAINLTTKKKKEFSIIKNRKLSWSFVKGELAAFVLLSSRGRDRAVFYNLTSDKRVEIKAGNIQLERASADGSLFAFFDSDIKTIIMVETATGKEVWRYAIDPNDITFSKNGEELLIATDYTESRKRGKLISYNLKTKEKNSVDHKVYDAKIRESPDGLRIGLSGSSDGLMPKDATNAAVYIRATGEVIGMAPLEQGFKEINLSPDLMQATVEQNGKRGIIGWGSFFEPLVEKDGSYIDEAWSQNGEVLAISQGSKVMSFTGK